MHGTCYVLYAATLCRATSIANAALFNAPLMHESRATRHVWGAIELGAADGKLKKVPASGGSAQIICASPNGRGGTWNAHGVIVFAPSIGVFGPADFFNQAVSHLRGFARFDVTQENSRRSKGGTLHRAGLSHVCERTTSCD